MTLQEAYNFFERLKTETSKKSDIKVYKKILDILSGLKSREFSKEEIQSLEMELDSLNVDSNFKDRKKHFKRALTKFEKYLKDTFSLTSKTYYTQLYGGLGLSFGVLFGLVFLSSWERSLGLSMGIIGGMLIGSTIGRSMDAKAISEGKVL